MHRKPPSMQSTGSSETFCVACPVGAQICRSEECRSGTSPPLNGSEPYPAAASQLQLEGPLHASPSMPTPMPAPSSGSMVPDINDVDPMDDTEFPAATPSMVTQWFKNYEVIKHGQQLPERERLRTSLRPCM